MPRSPHAGQLKRSTPAAAFAGSFVFNAFASFLQPDQIAFDDALLDRCAATCGERGVRPIAVLFPHDTADVSKIVRAANDTDTPLYPVSRGRNWGYGCASPVRGGSIIVDLSRMRRIVEVEPELGYAVIEPGVTQAQLYELLDKQGLSLMLDVTGAPPDSSVLANILERGYGLGHYGDHFLHSCAMEVVLPDGEILRTGFGHFPGSQNEHVFKWGIGPWLDGLFSQSNLGIVTRITVWLTKRPAYTAAFSIALRDDASLCLVAEKWRDLKLSGAFPGQIRFANDIRMLSCFDQYPFDRCPDGGTLPAGVKSELLRRRGLSAWNAFGTFSGERKLVQAQLAVFRDAVKSIAKPSVLTDKQLSRNPALLDLMIGKPTAAPTFGAYWRKRLPPPQGNPDPVRDRCGLLWCSPVLPASGSRLLPWLEEVTGIFEAHGLETNIGIVPVNDRAVCSTISVVFDQDAAGERARGEACHHALLKAAVTRGFHPYRFGIDIEEARDLLFSASDPYWNLCRQIKQCVDPSGVIAPGRYGIG